jgi:hypothetical protein
MPKTHRAAVLSLLTLAGFVIFFASAGLWSPWLLPPAAIFSLTLLKRPRAILAAFNASCFLPYAAGWLILPMRFFYWDRPDFAARVQNLALLAAAFSIWLIARKQRWWQRFHCAFDSLALKKRLWLIFIGAEVLFIAAAALITRQGVTLVGDEPHYLAISQSLARDGDLNVFNQYFRGGFREFFSVEKLAAHGTWGKGYKKIYSYHLPGVSLTLVPFFFCKLSPPLLYFLLRAYLGLFGALLAVLVYLFGLRLTRSRPLALFASMVSSFSVPVFFYSFHLFPEVQAMLLVLSALYLLLYKVKNRPSYSLWAGLLLGGTIFWGVKYALFIYPFCLGFFAYWLWQKKFRPAILLIVFPLFFQALFFYYLYGAYGSFSPNAVYYGMLDAAGTKAFYETILSRITLTMRWETLLDYFFDQRDGLLLYNPFYFFAFPGLLLALKHYKRYRPHLLIVLPAALFALNHAFSTVRPGYCPQARYLTPLAWALMLLALIYYRESRNETGKRIFRLMPLYSFFVVAYQTWRPVTLYQPTTHDTLVRPGLLFSEWSNVFFRLPRLLPSYIKADNSGYWPNVAFLGLFILCCVLAVRRGRRRRMRGAPLLLFLAVFSLSSLLPRPDLASPRPLTDSRGFPARIYFAPQPDVQVDDRTWVFSGPGSGRILIESRLPFKNVTLEIENRSAREELQLAVAAFDGVPQRRQLPAAASTRILLRPPAYKKAGKSYFCQLYVRAETPSARVIPVWKLRVHSR